jgi:beta-glucanase (GH16 family)
LGYGSWPSCGELDICEFQGSHPAQFQSNIHTKDYNGTNGTNFHLVKPVPNLTDSFHIYSIEWTSAYIKFFFDGAEYWEFEAAEVLPVDYPFTGPVYIILNLAIGGTMGGTVDNTIFPQQMLVDYVRVYQDASTAVNNPISKDNPVIQTFITDNINITFPDSYPPGKSIAVYDVNGRTILTKQTTESKVELDAGSFMKGMYLVKIVSGDKSYTQKVIKK